jgi:hypothetical protein
MMNQKHCEGGAILAYFKILPQHSPTLRARNRNGNSYSKTSVKYTSKGYRRDEDMDAFIRTD